MKKNILQFLASILVLLVLVAIINIIVTTRPQVNAQAGEQALEERLTQLGIPAKSINITKQSPLHLEVSLQSTSNDSKTNHNDLWYNFLTERELDLAYLTVKLPIESYRITIVTDKGEILYDSTVFLHSSLPSQSLSLQPPSSLDSNKITDIVEQNMDFQELELISLEVPSSYTTVTGYNLLSLELSTKADADKDSSAQINPFIMSIRQQVEGINSRYNTRIVIVRARIRNPEGLLLVDYMTDLERGGQSSWVADGIQGSWFSHPAPLFTPRASEPSETSIPPTTMPPTITPVTTPSGPPPAYPPPTPYP